MNDTTLTNPELKIFGTLRDDLNCGGFGRTVKRDFQEVKEYMLEEERKKRLETMGWLERWFVLTWWLLKSLFFKLTSTKRLLFVIGLGFSLEAS